MKDLSIIIPCYNATKTINRCLNSIYSQGLDERDFEVICVDDCSNDPTMVLTINNYKYMGVHPANLRLIKHSENKRQGEARNTGLRAATADGILFMDADDYYLKGALKTLLITKQKYPNLDFIMFDGIRETYSGIEEAPFSAHNTTEIMNGREFFLKQHLPLGPSLLLYKRTTMIASHFLFPENVYF